MVSKVLVADHGQQGTDGSLARGVDKHAAVRAGYRDLLHFIGNGMKCGRGFLHIGAVSAEYQLG